MLGGMWSASFPEPPRGFVASSIKNRLVTVTLHAFPPFSPCSRTLPVYLPLYALNLARANACARTPLDHALGHWCCRVRSAYYLDGRLGRATRTCYDVQGASPFEIAFLFACIDAPSLGGRTRCTRSRTGSGSRSCSRPGFCAAGHGRCAISCARMMRLRWVSPCHPHFLAFKTVHVLTSFLRRTHSADVSCRDGARAAYREG